MPLLTTFKAHFKAACADCGLSSLLAFLDIADTVRKWTPAKRWIQVNYNILVEPQVLGKDVLASKLADIFACVHFTTSILHARDLENTAFSDLDLEMILNAISALEMPTAQTKHVLRSVLTHIYWTCHHLTSYEGRIFLTR